MSARVLAFQKSEGGTETLIDEIGLYVYEYAKRRRGWEHDEACEFYISFYHRVPKLLSRFVYTGVPFEAYLHVSLKWHLKTFSTSLAQNAAALRIVTRDEFWQSTAAPSTEVKDELEDEIISINPNTLDDPALKRLFKIDDFGNLRTPASRRRLLLMILKEIEHLDHGTIEKLVQWGRFDDAWFQDRVAVLRERMDIKRQRLSRLQTRRNHLFYQLYGFQDSLDLACTDDEKEEIRQKISIYQAKFSYILKEIVKVSLRPTHRDLAEVLGIPKGSIDSGFYAIHRAVAIGNRIDSQLAA